MHTRLHHFADNEVALKNRLPYQTSCDLLKCLERNRKRDGRILLSFSKKRMLTGVLWRAVAAVVIVHERAGRKQALAERLDELLLQKRFDFFWYLLIHQLVLNRHCTRSITGDPGIKVSTL